MAQKFCPSLDQLKSMLSEVSRRIKGKEGHYVNSRTVHSVMSRYGFSTEQIETFIKSRDKVSKSEFQPSITEDTTGLKNKWVPCYKWFKNAVYVRVDNIEVE